MKLNKVTEERMSEIVAEYEGTGYNVPTVVFVCDCGEELLRFRGQSEMYCNACGSRFNSWGQRVRFSLSGDLAPAGFDPSYAGEEW